MPRPRGHALGEPASHLVDAAAGGAGHHEGGLERHPPVELGGKLQQLRLLGDHVDLGQHQHPRLRRAGELVEDRLDLRIDAAPGVDEQADDVGVGRPAPGGGDHGAVEPALRREDAGGVDQHDLRRALHGDAAHQGAGGLHLVGDDRHLGADQRVDQRRLAGVRRADQGDEAAARRGGRGFRHYVLISVSGRSRRDLRISTCRKSAVRARIFGEPAYDPAGSAGNRIMSDPPEMTPCRTRNSSAADCSASRLERPPPSTAGRPGSSTAMVKRGEWSGPTRSTTR